VAAESGSVWGARADLHLDALHDDNTQPVATQWAATLVPLILHKFLNKHVSAKL